jgi:hypothetical protein
LKSDSPTSNKYGAAAGLLTLLNLALFFFPAVIIRPFKHQSETGLMWAIQVKQVAPLVSLIVAAGVLFLVFKSWRESRWRLRAGLVLAATLSIGSAVMVRANYFEWMFQPIRAAGFTSASDAHLADSEMVMTVRLGSDVRAYPILQMAYHHVLNDTVGGVPIVVTY